MSPERDEPVRWEGRPSWRSAAIHVFHVRPVAAYFSALILFSTLSARLLGASRPEVAGAVGKLLASALAVLAVIAVVAFLTERTTRYTLTDRALVMRFGLALPATLVIPLGAIEHVALKLRPDHTGDVALRLAAGQRIAYPKLWPHARAWRFNRPEPMLRSVPHAAMVGTLLARSVAAVAAERAISAQAT